MHFEINLKRKFSDKFSKKRTKSLKLEIRNHLHILVLKIMNIGLQRKNPWNI